MSIQETANVQKTNARENNLTFMDEVREQPEALKQFITFAFEETKMEKVLDAVMMQRKNPYIVFTGMGSSLYACYITMKFIQNRGIRATVIESLELQNMEISFFTEDMIIVAVSQSGESPEVIELIEVLKKNMPRIPIIGVVNYPKSRLYNMADIAFRIYAGTEYFTSTKTYTNTIAGMILLAYRIAGCSDEECESLKQQMEQCCLKMEILIQNEHLGEEIGSFIEEIKFLICVGAGYSYTTASHSEVVAEEAGKFYASRFTPAQFIHGPIELINPGFGVLLFDFDAKYHQKCGDVRENVLRYGGKVLLVTNRTDVETRQNQLVCVIDHEDPLTATLLEVIPLELGIDSLCKKRGLATGSLSRVVKRMAK